MRAGKRAKFLQIQIRFTSVVFESFTDECKSQWETKGAEFVFEAIGTFSYLFIFCTPVNAKSMHKAFQNPAIFYFQILSVSN